MRLQRDWMRCAGGVAVRYKCAAVWCARCDDSSRERAFALTFSSGPCSVSIFFLSVGSNQTQTKVEGKGKVLLASCWGHQ